MMRPAYHVLYSVSVCLVGALLSMLSINYLYVWVSVCLSVCTVRLVHPFVRMSCPLPKAPSASPTHAVCLRVGAEQRGLPLADHSAHVHCRPGRSLEGSIFQAREVTMSGGAVLKDA